MPSVNLSAIDVLLIEPNPEVRGALRDGLKAHGIGNVVAASTAEEAAKLAAETLFDLVIWDHAPPADAVPSLPRAIRHGAVGENPFPVIIVTMRRTETSAVKRVIDDGIDNILARPFGLTSLIDRITAMIHSRRPFAVTSSYIGPDRRLVPRPQVGLPLIAVPNTLQDKALDRFDAGRFRVEMNLARSKVNLQKLVHGALMVTSVAEQVARHYESGTEDESVRLHLDLLVEQTCEIGRCLAGTPDAHVSALCESMLRVLDDIRRRYLKPEKKDVELLRNLGQAIHMSLRPDEKIASLSKDIAGSIIGAKRDQRGQTAAEAAPALRSRTT